MKYLFILAGFIFMSSSANAQNWFSEDSTLPHETASTARKCLDALMFNALLSHHQYHFNKNGLLPAKLESVKEIVADDWIYSDGTRTEVELRNLLEGTSSIAQVSVVLNAEANDARGVLKHLKGEMNARIDWNNLQNKKAGVTCTMVSLEVTEKESGKKTPYLVDLLHALPIE